MEDRARVKAEESLGEDIGGQTGGQGDNLTSQLRDLFSVVHKAKKNKINPNPSKANA